MTVKCLKGSDSLGLVKGRVYPVLDVFQLGKEFGHEVRILIQKTGSRQSLYVPMVHKNQLAKPTGFNVNRGDPTKKARLAFVTGFTVRESGKQPTYYELQER